MALASVMLWRRNHDTALVEAGRMIALDPNYAQGYGMIGLVQIYASQPAAALRSFAKGMRLDPHYATIMFHFQAQAQFSLGEFETAAALLRERITRDPGTDASRMLLASCYGHLGRTAEAREAWAALLKVNPGFQLAQRARVLPYKDPAEFQRIVEGLALAGLP
jgi:adenylate cyclase